MSKFRQYDKYEVFDDGRIWSYKTKRFLKPHKRKDGYQLVGLYDNEGKRKFYMVHRIVYESVTGEHIPEGMQINHIDENKVNNVKSNLELVTPKQNSNWGTRNSRVSKAKKGIIPKANPPKQVGAFNENGELVFVFPSTMEAGRNGFNQGNVSACCNKCFHREGNNVYKGLTWRYI